MQTQADSHPNMPVADPTAHRFVYAPNDTQLSDQIVSGHSVYTPSPPVRAASPWPVVIGLFVAALLVFAGWYAYDAGLFAPQPELTTAQIRQQAQKLTYLELQQNTAAHIGEIVLLYGPAEIVHKDGEKVTLLLNVSKARKDTLMDALLGQLQNVWVHATVTTPTTVGAVNPALHSGKVVRVYGRVEGSRSYTSPLGFEIAIPEVTALLVE